AREADGERTGSSRGVRTRNVTCARGPRRVGAWPFVTGSLSLYRLGTRLLEPAAPMLVKRRLKAGKERPERISERFVQPRVERPAGALLWMHGASVGECRLLLDVFTAVRKKRPDVTALITSQTLTSADMVSAWAARGVIHQMAPVDAPGAVN